MGLNVATVDMILMIENMVKNLWWGYIHINGSVQVKRYFNPDDLKEARESDFTEIVQGPFAAATREDALKKLDSLVNTGS